MKIEVYKTSAGFTVLINDYRVCGIKLLPGNKCLYSSPISEDTLVSAQQNNKVDLQTTTNTSMTKLLDNIERLINGVEPQYYLVPLKIMDVKREILDCISQLRHR